jgi:hypothetical protein
LTCRETGGGGEGERRSPTRRGTKKELESVFAAGTSAESNPQLLVLPTLQVQGVLQMATQQSRIYNLALDEEEREELLQVLEQCVTETRDEKRHTDSSQYRDRVAGEESRLRTLLEKVRLLAQ